MGKFIIHKTATGFRFLLKAGNGQVLAASEVYRSRRACQQGMDSVRKNTAAPVEDQTRQGAEPLPCPKFELYRDKTGSFRFRLRARNGEIIAAIALAVKLNKAEMHDRESDVITINKVARVYSPWSSKIHGLTPMPERIRK